MSEKQEEKRKTSDIILAQRRIRGQRSWACDNVAESITPLNRSVITAEAEQAFGDFLSSLLIDWKNDPNSADTPRRVAEMYVDELMAGRYEEQPNITAFPNTDSESRYAGMITVRAEILSMCSHHHQPVKGVCYIGILPSMKVIGLSKYARLAQWCARRGTLQEELTHQIADVIQKETGTKDLGVYIQAEHGCMTNRGVLAHSSLTQTTELRGQFYNPSVKSEFLANVQMQQQHEK